MKKVLLSLLVLTSTLAEAAPYYRFWRGYKKDSLTTEAFNKAIQDVFVEATVENGAGNGLTAYIPALPVAVDGVKVPDEIALVVYESKDKYDILKATPTGTNYTNLHWEYFTRAPLNPEEPTPAYISKSTVPTVVTAELAQLENGLAYDFLGTNPDWQKALVKIRFLKRNAATELEAVKKLQKEFAPLAEGFLLLVDADYIMTYEAWKNEDTLKESGVETFISENFKGLENKPGENQIVAAKTGKNLEGMQDLKLPQGGALSAQFDVNEKVIYVAPADVDSYILKTLQDSYSTFVDHNLLESNDTATKLERTYTVKYKDEQGVPTAHTDEVKFLFEKSPIQADQKLIVILNGEIQR